MFPSPKVQLNPVTLKNIIGLKLVPRRRRLPTSQNNVTVNVPKQERGHLVSELVSDKDTTSVCSTSEPQSLLTEKIGPEKIADMAHIIPEGQPKENCVEIDRKTHPNPTGLAVSEVSLRRVARASGCGLCGDCKYVSPRQKTYGKEGQKSSSSAPEQHSFEVKIEEENRDPEASQSIIIWVGQYPKVTLCDISQNCHAFGQDCGYMLPDLLKTKTVRCFKLEMRTGFGLEPSFIGRTKCKSEAGTLAKNKVTCPRVQSKKSICQSQSLTEHQRHVKKCPNAWMLSSHACCFPKSRTSEDSATCSASSSQGKYAIKGGCETDMSDRDVGEDPRPGCGNDGVRPPTPDLECITCKKTDSRDEEKTCSWIYDDSQSCTEHAAGSSGTLGSAVKVNIVHKKPDGEIDSQANTDAAQMSSELFCQGNRGETDELESSTCQRVRVYLRKNHYSCARTYMSWPFSNSVRIPTAHALTSPCPAEPIDPSFNSDSPINQNKPGTPSSCTNDMLRNTPKGPFRDKTQQVSQNNRKRDRAGESVVAGRNGKRHGNMSSYSPDSSNVKFVPYSVEAEEYQADPKGELAADRASASSLPINGMQTDRSTSTPSPSAIGLSDWDTVAVLSPMSSTSTASGLSSLSATPFLLRPSSFLPLKVRSVDLTDASSHNCVVKAVEKSSLCCEETQMTSYSFSSGPPHDSDSIQSCDSSLLLSQDKRESDEELVSDRCPPQLEPYYDTGPINCSLVKESMLHNVLSETEFTPPPILSPVTSPRGCARTSLLPQSRGYSGENEEINKGFCKHNISTGCYKSQIVNGSNTNSKDDIEWEGITTNFKPVTTPRGPRSSPSNDGDQEDSEVESQDETDHEGGAEQGKKKYEPLPSDSKLKAAFNTGVLREHRSSAASDEDDDGAEGWSSSEVARGEEKGQSKEEAAGDTRDGILDEFTAYEQDILLVDVILDDPELFGNLPQESLLKLGPDRGTETPESRPVRVGRNMMPRSHVASPNVEKSLPPVNIDYLCGSPDITEESDERPWRPKCSSTHVTTQSSTQLVTENLTRNMVQLDANNNHAREGLQRNRTVKTLKSLQNHIPPKNMKNGLQIANLANMADLCRQKTNAYCRQYFSESLYCGFKMCRFQHVPMEGDEKFCIETVTRFTKNLMCLHKAGAVFTGYYRNNPPGVHFSMPVLRALLWALLKAGMVPDIFSVLSVSLGHNIMPGYEFLLALFNFVREKHLMGLMPELMQLTFKMASAGLALSLDCLDSVKNTPDVQQAVCLNSESSNANLSECLNLAAHAMVEIELCTKQEDWRQMGKVFRSVCHSSQRPEQMENISGRITIALLSESKDKLSLPFAVFAATVCQNAGEDGLVRSMLGRIGVSLMLRYHKTHQWAKGRRVVEVLSISKINYSTLKGLFGNENRASRCLLVSVATELFVLSGSVEGALNTLRENQWFLSSSLWPCEPADLESRIRVLIRLTEKTSHRDTLEILCNLPGLKEPNDSVNTSRYCPLFSAHLQVCMERQTLSAASDTVDFMLARNLAVDHTMLQTLLQKLGKQNLWLRAREVFKHSRSVGYYLGVSAPPGVMALTVPCQLGEVELALAFEMFITVNGTAILHVTETTTCSLSITLKRTQSCEREYLSAGSRVLSAACITQPKLIIHFKAVNPSQEQMFTVDVSSARSWLRHNLSWANEMWAH